MFWTGETYFALGVCLFSNYVCVLRRCPLFALIATQADLSHSESVFFIPGLQYIQLWCISFGTGVGQFRCQGEKGKKGRKLCPHSWFKGAPFLELKTEKILRFSHQSTLSHRIVISLTGEKGRLWTSVCSNM